MHFDPLSRFRNDASCTPFNNTFGYTVYKNSLEIDNIDPGHGGRSDDYLLHTRIESFITVSRFKSHILDC